MSTYFRTRQNVAKCKSTHVTTLTISGLLNRKDVQALSEYKELKDLDLRNISQFDKVSDFPDFPNLEVLALPTDIFIPTEWYSQIPQKCPKLRVLEIPFYYQGFTNCKQFDQFAQLDTLFHLSVLGIDEYHRSPRGEGVTYVIPTCQNKPQLVPVIIVSGFYITPDGFEKEPRGLFSPSRYLNVNEVSIYCANGAVDFENIDYLNNGTQNSECDGDIVLHRVKNIPDLYFKDSHITSCIIGDQVSTVGKEVFKDCKELKNITFESSNDTLKLDGDVFDGCSQLEHIVFNRPVLITGYSNGNIGKGSLKKMVFNQDVRISSSAFYQTSIDTLVFKKDAQLEKSAFGNVSEVYFETIPTSITRLFSRNNEINTIYAPDEGYGAIHIPDGDVARQSFLNFGIRPSKIFQQHPINRKTMYKIKQPQAGTILEYLDINAMPYVDSITIVGLLNENDLKVLNGLPSLRYLDMEWTYIVSDKKNPPASYLLQKDATKMLAFDCLESEIPFAAFAENDHLEEIKLPICLGWISNKAFSHCSYLRRVKFPRKLRGIGIQAFDECFSLEGDLVFPDDLYTIMEWAFRECQSISKVDLSRTYADVDSRAFLHCNNLKEIHLQKKSFYVSTYGGNRDGVTIYAQDQGNFCNSDHKEISNSTIYFTKRVPVYDKSNGNSKNNIYYIPKGQKTAFYALFGNNFLKVFELK